MTDFGKMAALRRAGWACREIAGELGMTDGEYCAAISAKLDEIDSKIQGLEREYRGYAALVTGE